MVSHHAPSNDDSESDRAVLKRAARLDAPPLVVGTILSARYRLTETLEVGEAATEYRAERIADGKMVTIQVFHEVGRSDWRQIERLQRPTARDARPLDLPSVFVAVFECALTDDGRLFLVTELVDGPSVADLLSQGPLTPLRALELAMRVGEALEVALNWGFVDLRLAAPHDLVVVQNEDRIRLRRSDVAILKRLGLADQLAAAEAPGSDLRYTPPEEARGLPATEAGVVYQFGLLLHELLCGRPPFEAATHAEVRNLKRRPPEVQIRKRHQAFPSSADQLVSRMLHPVPEMRPESLTLVLNDLWSAMAHVRAKMPNGLDGPGGEGAAPLPTRRLRTPNWALAGLAALVLGGALMTWLYVGRGGLPVRPRLETVAPRIPSEAPPPPMAPPQPRDSAGGQFSRQDSEGRQPSDLPAPDIAPRPPAPTPPTGGSAPKPPGSKGGTALSGTSTPQRGAREATPKQVVPAPRTVDPLRTPVAIEVPAAQSDTEPAAASTEGSPPPPSVPKAQVSPPPARPAQLPSDNPRAADPGAIIDWLVRESPRVTE